MGRVTAAVDACMQRARPLGLARPCPDDVAPMGHRPVLLHPLPPPVLKGIEDLKLRGKQEDEVKAKTKELVQRHLTASAGSRTGGLHTT